MNNLTTEDGKIKCAICGQVFSRITQKHLNKHDISVAEYKKKFPDAPLSGLALMAKLHHGDSSLFIKEEKEDPTDIINELMKKNVPDPNLEIDEHLFKITNPVKREIYSVIKKYFPDVVPDYNIKKFNLQRSLEYSIITDLADPHRLIDFEFPNAYWHNPGFYYHSPVREQLLRNDSWKVIIIESKYPTVEKIEQICQNLQDSLHHSR